MKYLILIIFSLILITSCEKSNELIDNQTIGKPDIPVNDSIDLNSDQIIDFVISYKEFATYDQPSTGGSIIGSFNPLFQNQLLYRENTGYLFLDINDTIRKSSNTNSGWNGYSADLININRDYQNWDRTWTVISEADYFYFLAYKIKLNDSEKIGWICCEFDTETGGITIVDGDSSDNDELIIHKKTIN